MAVVVCEGEAKRSKNVCCCFWPAFRFVPRSRLFFLGEGEALPVIGFARAKKRTLYACVRRAGEKGFGHTTLLRAGNRVQDNFYASSRLSNSVGFATVYAAREATARLQQTVVRWRACCRSESEPISPLKRSLTLAAIRPSYQGTYLRERKLTSGGTLVAFSFKLISLLCCTPHGTACAP